MAALSFIDLEEPGLNLFNFAEDKNLAFSLPCASPKSKKPLTLVSAFCISCVLSDSRSTVSLHPQENFIHASIYEFNHMNILVVCKIEFFYHLMAVALTPNPCPEQRRHTALIFAYELIDHLSEPSMAPLSLPSSLLKYFFQQIQQFIFFTVTLPPTIPHSSHRDHVMFQSTLLSKNLALGLWNSSEPLVGIWIAQGWKAR